MNDLTKLSVLYDASNKGVRTLFSLILSLFLFGCASNAIKTDVVESVKDTTKPKSIFVFIDGTGNSSKVPTNVYRAFEAIKENNDEQTLAYYIVGVGNANDPIEGAVEKIFAFGMEERILKGYKFITKNYRPRDRIYIFGFSRGAHTARWLAGLISYAGVPKLEDAELNESIWDSFFTSEWNIGNKILEFTRKQIDISHAEDWRNWKRGDAPILAESINDEVKSILGRSKNIEVQSAEIEFLGVWDTVPGSQGINYFDNKTDVVCKQHKDSTDNKQRYQIDSYPPIRHIAHAVSKDEMRSEFKPLFLCSKKIDINSVHNENLTKLDEMVFPGAHADVGGGYEHKNNQLPDISLNWMIERLEEHYSLPNKHKFIDDELKTKAKGLANLSISDKKGSMGSSCINRELPPDITFHDSITIRDKAGAVPWLYFDKKPKGDYPEQSCKDWVNPKPDGTKEENVLCIKQSSITCSNLGY